MGMFHRARTTSPAKYSSNRQFASSGTAVGRMHTRCIPTYARAVRLPLLAVHGGAGAVPEHRLAPSQAGCEAAVEAAWPVLLRGDVRAAVVAAVRVLEDLPVFNAGTGSVPNTAGVVELDAAAMLGTGLRFGAVIGVRQTRNPVLITEALLDEEFGVLAGPPADEIGARLGLAVDNAALRRAASGTPVGDTVGAIAVDAEGRCAAALSTGGRSGQPPGRVGDVPLPGCGLYADDRLGAAAATGNGEAIMRTVLAHRALVLLGTGIDPAVAARDALAVMQMDTGGTGGLLLANAKGALGIACTTQAMSFAWRRSDAGGAGVHPDGTLL